MELLIAGKIMIKQIDEEDVVYLASNYYVELNSARLLTDLQLRYDMEQDELEREIQKIEKEEKLTLDELQRTAVKSAIEPGWQLLPVVPEPEKRRSSMLLSNISPRRVWRSSFVHRPGVQRSV